MASNYYNPFNSYQGLMQPKTTQPRYRSSYNPYSSYNYVPYYGYGQNI